MKLLWEEKAWEEYCEWQNEDKKTLKRINSIIKDIQRGTFDGIGKPEPLKDNLRGWWSRRIDEAKREDCSKIQRRGKPTNSALLESHYQSEHLQDIGMSRPICCYTSK